jgi:DNA-binding transcriptional LysR family regulator
VPRLVRTPEVTELRSLCAAAELGSVGRASVRLGVSQPALSKRLQTLERLAGVQLLERSPRGVQLTPAGRRVYEEARRLLERADAIEDVLVGLRSGGGPVRLACSHSAAEAFVTDLLGRLDALHELTVELIAANSQIVRGLVADGRADLGVAARRPRATPNPAVRELPLIQDAIVCAVPPSHPWALRRRVGRAEFLRTPMVVRDPQSNARWTVEAVLRRHGLEAARPLVQVPTPAVAKREALARTAPLLLSRHVLRRTPFTIVEVEGLRFPRHFDLVVPAVGEPAGPVQMLMDHLRDAAAALEEPVGAAG